MHATHYSVPRPTPSMDSALLFPSQSDPYIPDLCPLFPANGLNATVSLRLPTASAPPSPASTYSLHGSASSTQIFSPVSCAVVSSSPAPRHPLLFYACIFRTPYVRLHPLGQRTSHIPRKSVRSCILGTGIS